MKWFIKQLFPLLQYSSYSTNDHREVAVWRQWFGRVLWVKRWIVE